MELRRQHPEQRSVLIIVVIMTSYFLFSIPNYLRSFRVSSDSAPGVLICPMTVHINFFYKNMGLDFKVREIEKLSWP